MEFLGWMALVGILLLVLALAPALLRRLPLSTSIIYMFMGLMAGHAGFGWLSLNLTEAGDWMERLTEVAVIVSLFMGGLKLRLPLRDPAWFAAYRLAGPVMLVCIVGLALVAHFGLGLDLGLALLLGAVLAPTDPVLASAVAVNDASDHDRMRYGLSAEAGLNDGMAFPFVVLGLLWTEHGGPGQWMWGWFAHRVLWAVPAGLLVGYGLGRLVGKLAVWLRGRHRDTNAPTDFLALALIALAYVVADKIGAWGFLSVFAAGVGLRHVELNVTTHHPEHGRRDTATPLQPPPAETMVAATVKAEELDDPAVAAGVIVAEALSFGGTAERLLELFVVFIIGLSLNIHWNAGALIIASALLFVIRPLATFALLWRSPTNHTQRGLLGWFGIRGIGSLYYLAYAQTHGLVGARAIEAIDLTISVVALSILAHGMTTHPAMRWYEKRLHAQTPS